MFVFLGSINNNIALTDTVYDFFFKNPQHM